MAVIIIIFRISGESGENSWSEYWQKKFLPKISYVEKILCACLIFFLDFCDLFLPTARIQPIHLRCVTHRKSGLATILDGAQKFAQAYSGVRRWEKLANTAEAHGQHLISEFEMHQ